MSKDFTFSGFEGFAMINGVLTPVKVAKVVLNSNRVFVYTTDKGEFEDLVLYKSREDFEQNHPNKETCRIPEDKWGDIADDGELVRTLWTMEDGEPKSTKMSIGFHIIGLWYATPVMPEHYYLSREECLANETYKYVDDSGNIKEKDGIAKSMRLTDEQKDYLESTLIPALKKAKEMGITIVLNNDTAAITAARWREGVIIEWCGDVPKDAEVTTSETFYPIEGVDIISETEESCYWRKR